MSLLPHLHSALVNRLREADLINLSADETFAAVIANKNFLGLRNLIFVTEEKLNRIPRHKKTDVVVVGSQEDWPTGPPGFPNKLRREWFDLAWVDAQV